MARVLDGSVTLKGQARTKQDDAHDSEMIDTSKSILHYADGYDDLLRRIRSRSLTHPLAVEGSDGEKSFALRQRELAYLRKSRKTCISIYLGKINLLWRNGFPYGLLTSISLNDIDILSDLNAVIQRDFERGSITEKQVSTMRAKLLSLFEQQASSDASPEKLPIEVWPEDKQPGEKAVDFLRRVWGESISAEASHRVLKNVIRGKNLALYRAVSTDFSRNGIPDDLSSWWELSPQRKQEEIDKLLSQHGIQKPEDAFRRGLPIDEAQRLYNAKKNRS